MAENKEITSKAESKAENKAITSKVK
ncbi:hypothetical protein CCACVL1_03514 [Corchorus capsularis]|uniref:Uncharacterized protein n=1 Tax=Corchorus capsularis TaxID=210143 RepID=A0A1R3JYT4_COCAP|nr:hypothetical protein CCACVL1_03514 [Corchorus capsularis]